MTRYDPNATLVHGNDCLSGGTGHQTKVGVGESSKTEPNSRITSESDSDALIV